MKNRAIIEAVKQFDESYPTFDIITIHASAFNLYYEVNFVYKRDNGYIEDETITIYKDDLEKK